MLERLFDSEYRDYCVRRREKARLTLQANPGMSAVDYCIMRTLPKYRDFVREQDPASWYDTVLMEHKRQQFQERTTALKQAVADADIKRRYSL